MDRQQSFAKISAAPKSTSSQVASYSSIKLKSNFNFIVQGCLDLDQTLLSFSYTTHDPPVRNESGLMTRLEVMVNPESISFTGSNNAWDLGFDSSMVSSSGKT